MRDLPEAFLQRMQEQLGSDYPAFLQEYEKESFHALRLNRGKISREAFLQMVPWQLQPVSWVDNGFYYQPDDPVTRHPLYYAGVYYIQEPSAMLPASRLPVLPGDKVLDLCAAPGGKTTELASRLQGRGLLIANDVSASRAKALVKNVSQWGIHNCCITAEEPEKLLEQFGCFFDKILVDAPCSGEGMFRRDPSLALSWQKRGPEAYAPLQKRILTAAVSMLRPGGYLLYSTCTFSEEEDEEVILAILKEHPELILEEIVPVSEGFSYGKGPAEKTVHVWPHRMKGEGHFLALLKKTAMMGEKDQETSYTGEVDLTAELVDLAADTKPSAAILRQQLCAQLSGSAPSAPGKRREKGKKKGFSGKKETGVPFAEVEKWIGCLPARLLREKRLLQVAEHYYLIPETALPGGIRYLRTGLWLGSDKGSCFEPSQALAMALLAGEYENCLFLPLDDERCIRYLKGETLFLTEKEEQDLKEGWVLVCAGSYSLGWAKRQDRTLKNKYYPGWRLQ